MMRTIQTSPEGEAAPSALVEYKPKNAKSNKSGGFDLNSLLDGPDEGHWVTLLHPSKNDVSQGEVKYPKP
jgi:hypothetical protein